MASNPWFEAALFESLTRLRAVASTDAYGDPSLDWSSPDELVMKVRTAPPIQKVRLGSHAADEDEDGRDAVRRDLEAWTSADDVTAYDRVLYNGITYEVLGTPGHRFDMDGNYQYTKILLREVAG